MKNNKTTIVKRPVPPRTLALSLWVAWPSRPGVRASRNGRFFYDPNRDEIAVPAADLSRFSVAATRIAKTRQREMPGFAFWRDFLHECGHALGHKSRLARDLSGRRGTRSYAEEEICAEGISAALCEWCGFPPAGKARERYVSEWSARLVDRRHTPGNDPGPDAATERAHRNAVKAVSFLFEKISSNANRKAGKEATA